MPESYAKGREEYVVVMVCFISTKHHTGTRSLPGDHTLCSSAQTPLTSCVSVSKAEGTREGKLTTEKAEIYLTLMVGKPERYISKISSCVIVTLLPSFGQ